MLILFRLCDYGIVLTFISNYGAGIDHIFRLELKSFQNPSSNLKNEKKIFSYLKYVIQVRNLANLAN